MPRRTKRLEHKLRLYPGQDDELICWMASLDDLPWGEKAQRVKHALLRGIRDNHGRKSTADSAPDVVNLAEIRRVVEAGVESALMRFGGQMVRADVATDADQDDEAEALLDGLGASLVLSVEGQ